MSSTAEPAPAPDAKDVLAGASVIEVPERGPVIAGGRVDGAALRRRNQARLRDARWPVVVLEGAGARELGERICEQVVPKRPADTPVLIKPNLCGFDALGNPQQNHGDDGLKGRITDPEFTRGVVRCLKARGHKRITIAEGCSVGNEMWQRIAERSGYQAMARDEGVKLIAMDDDGVFDQAPGQPGRPLAVSGMAETHVPTLMLPKILVEHLEAGLFLSLPKLKTHRYAVVSVSIKGTQGVVMRSEKSPAHAQKYRMHQELHTWMRERKDGEDERDGYVRSLELFAERVVDVMEVAPPDAVLVDAAPATSGDGFSLILPENKMLAIGGTNPVLVDKVGAQLLGLWNNDELAAQLGGHRTSPLITAAASRFGLDPSHVTVVGNGSRLVSEPHPARFRAIAPFSIGVDAPPP